MSLPIPAVPAVLGMSLFAQGLFLSPVFGAGFSNALQERILP